MTKHPIVNKVMPNMIREAFQFMSRRDSQQSDVKTIKPVQMKAYHQDKQRPYAHPYFWAPFILMGNWL